MTGGLVRRQEYTSSNKLYIILFFFSKVLLPVQVKINNKKKKKGGYYNLVADSPKSCPHDLARHSTAGDHLWILAALVRSSDWS